MKIPSLRTLRTWLKHFAFRQCCTLLLTACTLQAGYQKPPLNTPDSWSSAHTDVATTQLDTQWWLALQDPAINTLINNALLTSPTLAQAATRIDEANAALGISSAAKIPTISASASVNRAQNQNNAPGAKKTAISNSATAGPSFSWEIDLFGRIENSVTAAQSRLDARTADAHSTRLALTSNIANTVLALRACQNSQQVLRDDIASREKTLALTRLRLQAGAVAPIDEVRAMSGISNVRITLASQTELCTRHVNALVALSGLNSRTVGEQVDNSQAQAFQRSPAVQLMLPAALLTQHPSVIAAEREAATTWADIGVARANRLPRLDLGALLAGHWIRSAGNTLEFLTWSLGASLSGTLFEGGAGSSNVNAATARYQRAVLTLQDTLRNTVQEVENALAAQQSADSRLGFSRDNVNTARSTLQISEAQWKAGAISLFELEDSRRQFATAQDAEIIARRDHSQAWIALVKATGGALSITQEAPKS